MPKMELEMSNAAAKQYPMKNPPTRIIYENKPENTSKTQFKMNSNTHNSSNPI